MSILDNELVRKYFPCDRAHRDHGDTYILCGDVMAGKILTAMQEPIRKGERYLFWNGEEFRELNQHADLIGFHPNALRLPDRFQKREKCCDIDKYFNFSEKADLCPEHADFIRDAIYRSKPQPEAQKPGVFDSVAMLYKLGQINKPKDEEYLSRRINMLDKWHREEMASSYHYELTEILRELVRLARKNV